MDAWEDCKSVCNGSDIEMGPIAADVPTVSDDEVEACAYDADADVHPDGLHEPDGWDDCGSDNTEYDMEAPSAQELQQVLAKLAPPKKKRGRPFHSFGSKRVRQKQKAEEEAALAQHDVGSIEYARLFRRHPEPEQPRQQEQQLCLYGPANTSFGRPVQNIVKVANACGTTEPIDEVPKKLFNEPRKIASISAETERLGQPRRTVQRTVERLACSIIEVSRYFLAVLPDYVSRFSSSPPDASEAALDDYTKYDYILVEEVL